RGDRRRLGYFAGEFIEARQRLGFAADVELFPAHDEAVRTENPEPEIRPFEGTTALAQRAADPQAAQVRVGAQGEHIIVSGVEVTCEVDERAHVLANDLHSLPAPRPPPSPIAQLHLPSLA